MHGFKYSRYLLSIYICMYYKNGSMILLTAAVYEYRGAENVKCSLSVCMYLRLDMDGTGESEAGKLIPVNTPVNTPTVL